MTTHDKELLALEEKAESLITLAMERGAEANFHLVRRQMRLGRKYHSGESINEAIALLEHAVSKANRECARRSSRRPLSVRFKNLFGILS